MLQETFFMYIYIYVQIAEMEEYEVKSWLYLIC